MAELVRELVMYSRTTGCPFITIAKHVLDGADIPYRELMIDQDSRYEARVLHWTGFLSVPTLIMVEEGSDMPYEEPAFLERGATPRGVDRGSMLTEGNEEQLSAWLEKHGFSVPDDYKANGSAFMRF